MRKPKKWFQPNNRPLNWSKDDTQGVRRRNALAARKGDYLKTARALMALSNVTADKETKRKARSDALYFYREYKRRQV